MLNKNTNGVIIAEVLISAIILGIFYIGLFEFLDFQYKVWEKDHLNQDYNTLFAETKSIFSTLDYDSLSDGEYSLFYSGDNFGQYGSYTVQKIENNSTVYEGMKINSLGFKIENTSFEEKYYQRKIEIESLIFPFTNSGINIKKACVIIQANDNFKSPYIDCFYLTKRLNYYEEK